MRQTVFTGPDKWCAEDPGPLVNVPDGSAAWLFHNAQDRKTVAVFGGTYVRLQQFSHLGDVELDLDGGAIRRAGKVVTSRRQVVQLLAYLFSRSNQVVARDDLMQVLWPDNRGSAGALNFCMTKVRQVLGELPNGRLLTYRGRGYRLEVELANHRPDVDEAAAISGTYGITALLERQDQLATLMEQWRTVERAGQPRVVIIQAPAGFGKTALADEFARHLQREGQRFVWAGCVDGEPASAFWPWPEIVEGLSTRHRATEPSKPLHQYSAADRYRYFRRVHRALWNATRSAPLALVLDNMHEADPGALGVLRHVVSGDFRLPLMCLVLLRPGTTFALQKELAPLAKHARDVHLTPLSASAARSLLRRSCPDLSSEFERDAVRAAAGNPLYLCKLAQVVGALDDGDARGIEVALRARGLSHVLSLQIAALPAVTRSLLTAAAFIGDDFDASTLSITVGSRVSDVLTGLEPARAAGVVHALMQLRFRFEHDLFRSYLQDAVSAAERRRWHWRVAQALLMTSAEAVRNVARIAHHLSHGATTETEAREATDWCQRAGDTWLRASSFSQAALQYGEALSLNTLANLPAADVCRLQVRASLALRLAGDPHGARSAATVALELARSDANGELFAEAVLALAGTWNDSTRSTPDLEGLLIEAVERCEPLVPVRPRLLARLAMAYCSGGGDATCRSSSDAERLLSALDTSTGRSGHLLMARAYGRFSDTRLFGQLQKLADDAAARFAVDRNWEDEAQALTMARGFAIRNGDAQHARRIERRLALWRRSAPVSAWAYLGHSTDAALAVFRGDPRAPALIDEALAVGMRSVPESAKEAYLAHRFTLALEVGLSSDLDSLLGQVPEESKSTEIGLGIIAFCMALLWRDDQSRALYDQLMARVSADTGNRPFALVMLICELIAHHADQQRARGVLEALGSTAGCLGTTGAVGAVFGPMGYALGGLAASIGESERACEYFRAAGLTAAKFGSRRWVLRCEKAVARVRSGFNGGRWHVERAMVD